MGKTHKNLSIIQQNPSVINQEATMMLQIVFIFALLSVMQAERNFSPRFLPFVEHLQNRDDYTTDLPSQIPCDYPDAEEFCFHGGECVQMLVFGDTYETGCICDPERHYTGQRCDEINPEEVIREIPCDWPDNEQFCFHGGKCVQLLLWDGNYGTACYCDPERGYTGQRCDEINPDIYNQDYGV